MICQRGSSNEKLAEKRIKFTIPSIWFNTLSIEIFHSPFSYVKCNIPNFSHFTFFFFNRICRYFLGGNIININKQHKKNCPR